MDLRGMRSRNLKVLADNGNQALFERARARNEALAQHETMQSVLEMLRDETPETYPVRDTLTRVLIAELRRENHPFWHSALQLAYYPMLSHLRCRIRGEAVVGHEIDQVVITAFLEVLDTLPIGPEVDRICMRLSQSTRRRVFRFLRQEQRYQERFFLRSHRDITWMAEQAYPPEGDDPIEHKQRCLWPEPRPTASPPMDPEERAQQLALLDQHARGKVNLDGLELVIATLVYGEKLTDIARRQSVGASPTEQQRMYERIKRRHSRALARLRVVLAHLISSPLPRQQRRPGATAESRRPDHGPTARLQRIAK